MPFEHLEFEAHRLVAELIDDDPDHGGQRQVPRELDDLHDAARHALQRLAGVDGPHALDHPSLARVLHDITVAEVLSQRLVARRAPTTPPDRVHAVVARTLVYFLDLSATRHEGEPVTHGAVIGTLDHGWAGPHPPIQYPGDLAFRRRTPLLFDGTNRVLVLTMGGDVLRGVGRATLPRTSSPSGDVDVFDEVTGPEGSLTAAASQAFDGVGVYLRPDQTIWVFDAGVPLFIRRGNRWKPIAVASFADALAELGAAPRDVAGRIARTALRSSLRGSGALLAIASGPDALRGQVVEKDVYAHRSDARDGDVGDDLHRLIGPDDIAARGTLGLLAQLDGATIVDTRGGLLAFGAIVRSDDSRGEGARTAAARVLSLHVNVAISVSQDGPITVFHRGDPVLRLL
jgi:hypothetical protein